MILVSGRVASTCTVTIDDVFMFPALSVAFAIMDSESLSASPVTAYVHEVVPDANWYVAPLSMLTSTFANPAPPELSAAVPDTVKEPLRKAPEVGEVMDIVVGAMVSTVTVTGGIDIAVFPALSVAFATIE